MKLHEKFASMDTLIVGVSTTDSLERLQDFGRAHNVKFPLVSDPGRNIARMYKVRRWFGLGTSRVTYLIDKLGLIRDVHHSELFAAGHAHRMLASMQGRPISGSEGR